MPNQYIIERLAGIQTILRGVHQAGDPMSSATKGHERDAFVKNFLSEVMPLPYRFGTGEATDAAGNRSGQLDVVMEFPFFPNLPLGAGVSRLYLAEGVATAIEVKSDLSKQWDEAVKTATTLNTLNRKICTDIVIGSPPSEKIPLFVAAYTGWQQKETLERHLRDTPSITGALIIDTGIFVSNASSGGIWGTGPLALWALIASLFNVINSLKAARPDLMPYAS